MCEPVLLCCIVLRFCGFNGEVMKMVWDGVGCDQVALALFSHTERNLSVLCVLFCFRSFRFIFNCKVN